jgi:hypothetical protein
MTFIEQNIETNNLVGKICETILFMKPEYSSDSKNPLLYISGSKCRVVKEYQFHAPLVTAGGYWHETTDLCEFDRQLFYEAITQIQPGQQTIIHGRGMFDNKDVVWDEYRGVKDTSNFDYRNHESSIEDDITIEIFLSSDLTTASLTVYRGENTEKKPELYARIEKIAKLPKLEGAVMISNHHAKKT